MLFAEQGWLVWEKTVPSVLSTARGPWAQFFPKRISRPVNNIYLLLHHTHITMNTNNLFQHNSDGKNIKGGLRCM